MSLRMDLHGWKLQEFIDVIGSKNATVLERASAHLEELYKGAKDDDLSKALAWLHTLINEGHSLRWERERPAVAMDGALLAMQMEAGIHVNVIYSLVEAIRREEFLHPAFDSWGQGVSTGLRNEFSACGFIGSRECSIEFLQALHRLDGGTPLFGDDFYTSWQYYSIIENDRIAALVQGFEGVLRFERKLPADIPDHIRERFKVRVSDDYKKLISDLIGWLGQIEQAGQDAFILWS
jgi:hypothetical protein